VQALSEAKSLRWSYLATFPIVLLAIWAVVSVFIHSERARLVDKLTACVECGTPREAKAALRQMTHMPEPPLAAFSAAAASPTRAVARQAQESISELLRKWQSQLATHRNHDRVANRLAQLAAALDEHRDAFSTLDHAWLARTTERILRLANTAEPDDTLDFATHCESLLASAGVHPFDAPRKIVPVASVAIASAPAQIFDSPSQLALESIVPAEPASELESPPIDAASQQIDAASKRIAPHPFTQPQQNASEIKVASPIPVDDRLTATPNSPDPWAAVDSRTLLERWLASTGTKRQPIERELQHRGFGQLRSDIVRLAFSNDTKGRVELVHDLFDMPGVGAKPWLMLLAEDEDAEVRLAAVTVMALSKDSRLLEKAWQVALHDQDPRIAGLAPRLRDRRSTPQRH
jgi:hypothetical protein